MTFSSAAETDPTGPTPVPVANGDIVFHDSVCYSVPGHDALVGILQEKMHGREKAEDRIAVLEAEISVLRAQTEMHALDIQKWEITCEIERLKRPTWIEAHVGFCAGVGVGVNSDGEAEAMAGVIYGAKF